MVTVPVPPVAPAENCRSADPVTLPPNVMLFPVVAPSMVWADVLFVMVLLRVTPVVVATKPACAAVLVPIVTAPELVPFVPLRLMRRPPVPPVPIRLRVEPVPPVKLPKVQFGAVELSLRVRETPSLRDRDVAESGRPLFVLVIV